MISTHNASASQAAGYYYEKDPIFENNSQWQGKGAEALGLSGSVEKGDFEAVVSGIDPRTGEQLVKDGVNGEHRAGTDYTFSAPKSVSVAGLVLGEERVLEAHREAVTRTMEYAEEHLSQARQTVNGVTERVDTGNAVIAKFEHSTSREGDPQLHTHVLVMNMTQTPDGWRAVENKAMFENRQMLDSFYKNELVNGLQKAGIDAYTILNEKGVVDIRVNGLEGSEDVFSKRHDQIQEKAAELRENGKNEGVHDAEIRERANFETRASKGNLSRDELQSRWNRELQEIGKDKTTLLETMKGAGAGAGGEKQFSAEDYVKASTQAITETESTFTKGEVLKNALTLSGGAVPSKDIANAFETLQKSGEIVKLDKNTFSTKEMVKIEKEIMNKLASGKGQAEALMSKEEAAKAIDAYLSKNDLSMTAGQREYAEKLLSSTDKYMAVQGDAGTGKTFAVSVVKGVLETYANKNVELSGLGFTGKAAAELAKGGGIKAQTIDSFLIGANKDGTISDDSTISQAQSNNTNSTNNEESKGILIIDERKLNDKTTTNNETRQYQKQAEKKVELLNSNRDGGSVNYQFGTGNLSVGYKSTYDNGFGTTTYQKSERILFGKDKGTKTKTSTKVYGSTKLTKTDKTYKDGTKEKSETYSVGGIKNSTINKKFADGSKSEIKSKSFGDDSAFSLFSVKSQTEVITDKNGNKTMKESKSYGVFGYRWGKTTTRTADGRIIETSWKGVETVNWRGEKVLKITSSESREVQSTRAKLSLTKDGRVVMTKGAFSVVLPKKGEVTGPVKSMPNSIPSKEKIFVVDEASMMGSRQALEVFKAAEKAGGRVVMVGDVKQLLGVQAGKVFSDGQKYGVVDVTRMNEVLRQKSEDYKAVVSDITGKRLDKAFGRLEKGGNLHQISDRGERISELVKDYTSGKDWRDTIVVTTRNADRHEINQSIRGALKQEGKIGQKDHSLNVRTPKSISTVNRHFAQSFREGDYIFSSKSGEGLRAGDEAKILNINQKNHSLTLEKKTGEVVEFDLKKGGSSLSVYESQSKAFSEGEKIVFLKNSQKLGVQNGMTGTIKNVNEHGKITVETEMGKDVSFNIKNYGYFDHGYAVTDYKSQGQTSERVIFHADTNEGGNNFNSFYVAATRGKEEMKVYTDDADRLKTQVSEEQTKKTTLDYENKNGMESDKELNKTDDKSINDSKETKSEIDKIKSDLSEKIESSLKDTDRGEKGIERDKSSMKENTDSGKGNREMEKSESASSSTSSSAKTQDVGMEM